MSIKPTSKLLLNIMRKLRNLFTDKYAASIERSEFIQLRTRHRILDLAGKISFKDDWDYKKDRDRRI